MDIPAIESRQLGKTFPREGGAPWHRIKAALASRRPPAGNGRQVLTGIDLRVARGSGLGLIGPTGAGKSTLLRVLGGRTPHERGELQVSGRIALLCDPDFGLNPRISGRRNIRSNRIADCRANDRAMQRADEIVAFAEAEDFIDAPVYTYSTGIRRRLGLSIALHRDPDVLLIDDWLPDDDTRFEQRCQERIAELKASGTAVVLASRDFDALDASCEEVLWLEAGEVRDLGPARRVLRSYRWHACGASLPVASPTTQEDPAPFIIWTFRRTGGTHLAQALFDRALFDDLQHEPFNPDRVYGGVSRHWMEHEDESALRDALTQVCGQKWLMKHCVEMAPQELNRVLSEVSTRAGYRHVFLYRRNPLDRLLSLEFAQRSGAWGKDQVPQARMDDAIFSEPLPVEEMREHEVACREAAREVYTQLRGLGHRPVLLAFEDLFLAGDMKRTRQQLHAVLAALGLSRGEAEDDAFVARVLTNGDQGTRERYTRFADYLRLEEALAVLGEFDLRDAAPPIMMLEPDLPSCVEACAVWEPVPEPVTDCYTVAGLLLLGREAPEGSTIYIEDNEGPKEALWGLPSQRLAATHPENPRAAHARFEVRGVVLGTDGAARLMWRSPSGERALLAHLNRAPRDGSASPVVGDAATQPG